MKRVRAVIDSGSTLSFFPSAIFQSLKDVFLQHYSHLPTLNLSPNILDGFYVLTSDPSDTWPTIEFIFDGVSVSLPPSVYFYQLVEKGQLVWMFGIQPFSESVCSTDKITPST